MLTEGFVGLGSEDDEDVCGKAMEDPASVSARIKRTTSIFKT
jgi:hypothetical protein